MSSTIDHYCDFCKTPLPAAIYKPFGSRRGVEVAVCEFCGLMQSIETFASATERVMSLSCDADWGNVRHGKGARLAAAKQILESRNDWSQIKRVLDVGSNRGDFVLWLHRNQPNIAIHAVEPDASVAGAYKDEQGIELTLTRLEHASLAPETYDFVYCSHSLEHAPSASGMLRQIFHAMVPGGILYLEVPNIEALALEDTVEEFFIDKHSFHFDRHGLIEFVRHLGFEVISGLDDLDRFNITLLLRRGYVINENPYHPMRPATAAAHVELVLNYVGILTDNRAHLCRLVVDCIEPLMSRQKVAFWGGGRIFDALIKYGGLVATDVPLLVDSYLGEILTKTHGVPICKPQQLKIAEPQVVIVLARSAADAIAHEVRRLGVRHVIKFNDIFAQCR